MTRWARGGTAGLALIIALSGCSGEIGLSGESPSPKGGQPVGKPGGKKVTGAREDLKGLRTAPEGSSAGYSRDKFGQRWKDVDRNGCDQRNDVLARDLENEEKRGACVVVAGLLHDPYSGKDITFSKSDAAEVQIDHLYPLALAWRMGASGWDEGRREQFANDHDNLLAVWGTPNRQKSDSGPGEWKPQKAFQCTYAVKYVAVAQEYRLPVTGADRDALEGFLERC